ncbi:MAG TPA: PaaI family thioesterase [Thermomicrobiales bacterium]|jgi:3-hydroxymyristoyl/3-hydroxydecanoyl-(acyl carrier protein) dehydratase|nr:PaaI family thioesterase [Thermomicrobiales bacterium]
MSDATTDRTEPLNAIRDHHCFGCGDLNPHGLRLRLFLRDDPGGGVYADWTPVGTEEGYVGMVHGGIVSTVCDEVMAWSCYAREVWGVTARFNVRFRRPVLVGGSYRAEGWVVSERGRMVELAAAVRDRTNGQVVAEATAQFIRVGADQAAEWERRYGRLATGRDQG